MDAFLQWGGWWCAAIIAVAWAWCEVCRKNLRDEIDELRRDEERATEPEASACLD